MKTVIANCVNEAGRVGFAKLNETYERATKANAENVMDNDDVVVPQGEEVEAHLGHVDEENDDGDAQDKICLGVSDLSSRLDVRMMKTMYQTYLIILTPIRMMSNQVQVLTLL